MRVIQFIYSFASDYLAAIFDGPDALIGIHALVELTLHDRCSAIDHLQTVRLDINFHVASRGRPLDRYLDGEFR